MTTYFVVMRERKANSFAMDFKNKAWNYRVTPNGSTRNLPPGWRWITTKTGAHVLLDDKNRGVSGMNGKYSGKTFDEISKANDFYSEGALSPSELRKKGIKVASLYNRKKAAEMNDDNADAAGMWSIWFNQILEDNTYGNLYDSDNDDVSDEAVDALERKLNSAIDGEMPTEYTHWLKHEFDRLVEQSKDDSFPTARILAGFKKILHARPKPDIHRKEAAKMNKKYKKDKDFWDEIRMEADNDSVYEDETDEGDTIYKTDGGQAWEQFMDGIDEVSGYSDEELKEQKISRKYIDWLTGEMDRIKKSKKGKDPDKAWIELTKILEA